MATRDEIDKEIAAAVRAELARARIPAYQMAEHTGIDPGTFSRRLNAHYSFTARELILIARVLDIPITRLLPGD